MCMCGKKAFVGTGRTGGHAWIDTNLIHTHTHPPSKPPLTLHPTPRPTVSAVDLLCAWCRLAAARLRLLLVAHHADEDDDENSNEEEQRGEDATATVARWAATELLILFGSWLWCVTTRLGGTRVGGGARGRDTPNPMPTYPPNPKPPKKTGTS